MPQRICPDCHHLHDGPNQRCAHCQATAEHARDQRRGSRQDRGYGSEYDRNREAIVARAIAEARAGRPQPCCICLQPCLASDQLSAEHKLALRDGGTSAIANLAVAHLACNTAWNKRR